MTYNFTTFDATHRQLQLPSSLYQAITEKAAELRQRPADYIASLFLKETETITPQVDLLDLIQGGDRSFLEELEEINSPYVLNPKVKPSQYYSTAQAKKVLSSLDREQLLSRFSSGDFGLYSPRSSNPVFEQRYQENQTVLEAREGILKGIYWVDNLSFAIIGKITSTIGETSFAVLSLESEL